MMFVQRVSSFAKFTPERMGRAPSCSRKGDCGSVASKWNSNRHRYLSSTIGYKPNSVLLPGAHPVRTSFVCALKVLPEPQVPERARRAMECWVFAVLGLTGSHIRSL